MVSFHYISVFGYWEFSMTNKHGKKYSLVMNSYVCYDGINCK